MATLDDQISEQLDIQELFSVLFMQKTPSCWDLIGITEMLENSDINIRAKNDEIFRFCCTYNRVEYAQLLSSHVSEYEFTVENQRIISFKIGSESVVVPELPEVPIDEKDTITEEYAEELLKIINACGYDMSDDNISKETNDTKFKKLCNKKDLRALYKYAMKHDGYNVVIRDGQIVGWKLL
jgi:hypothetical protein